MRQIYQQQNLLLINGSIAAVNQQTQQYLLIICHLNFMSASKNYTAY